MPKEIITCKSVIFDMDGVITNTMPDHFKAWKIVFSNHGIKVTHDDIYCREGQPGFQSVVELYSKYGKQISKNQIKRILLEKENLFKEIVRERYIIGSRSFLKNLIRKGMTLALVTGTARHEMEKILPKSLKNLFSIHVTGDSVTHGKPHPEPYQTAIDKLNIKKRDSVVIENAPYGIQSAKAAGLKCFALETSLAKEHLFQADYVFSSFKDLNRKVEFQNG